MEKNWTTGSVGKSILRSGPLRLHPRTLPGLG